MKTVHDFYKRYGITEDQFYGKEGVGGSLYLGSVTSIPEGFNPTVGGSLYLGSVTSIPAGFNPTVGGSLDLPGVTSIPEGFNPTVGRDLYLSSVKSIPAGFSPTVGGYLDLRSVTSIPAGFNPTVGGSLYLWSVTSIPEGFIKTELPENYIFEWQSGRYIKADGIFAEVVTKHGNIYRLRKIGTKNIIYMITSDDGRIAHGSTLEDARNDLIYKITSRNVSDYEHLTLESELSFEEAVRCYRVITGACALGVRDFVESRLGEREESYTINEIIEHTAGEYGADRFKEFFLK